MDETQAKFTAGPWTFRLAQEGNRFLICDAEVSPMAAVYMTNDPDVARRRASQIAAAPDLLEALRKLANEASGFLALSDIERHGMTNSRILRDRIEQARDAIRKAEGR